MEIAGRKVATLACFSVVSLFVVGWPDFDRRDYDGLYDRIEIGMTLDQVKAIAGEPERTNGREFGQLVYRNAQVFPGLFRRDPKALLITYDSGRCTDVRLVHGSRNVHKSPLD